MKIGPIDQAAAVTQPVDRKGGSGSSPAAATADASAQVSLSASAQAAMAASSGDGSFDGAKVERIAQAIRDGNYKVNAQAIADKLIVNAQELLGRKAG